MGTEDKIGMRKKFLKVHLFHILFFSHSFLATVKFLVELFIPAQIIMHLAQFQLLHRMLQHASFWSNCNLIESLSKRILP
jgi:hypothetical protein